MSRTSTPAPAPSITSIHQLKPPANDPPCHHPSHPSIISSTLLSHPPRSSFFLSFFPSNHPSNKQTNKTNPRSPLPAHQTPTHSSHPNHPPTPHSSTERGLDTITALFLTPPAKPPSHSLSHPPKLKPAEPTRLPI